MSPRVVRRTIPCIRSTRTAHDPFAVEVMKLYAGGWGSKVPITVPAEGRIELVVHTLPGEERAAVVGEQTAWLAGVIDRNRAAFTTRPETGFHIRWLAPTAMGSAASVGHHARRQRIPGDVQDAGRGRGTVCV